MGKEKNCGQCVHYNSDNGRCVATTPAWVRETDKMQPVAEDDPQAMDCELFWDVTDFLEDWEDIIRHTVGKW